MSTVPVPRAAGQPGEVGNPLALRPALGGRPLLSGQGEWYPNVGPQDRIGDFQLSIRELGV